MDNLVDSATAVDEPGAGLSVRAMADALGLSHGAVHKNYTKGMPRTVDEARAWRLANLDISRTADTRIDRVSAPRDNPATSASAGAEQGMPDQPVDVGRGETGSEEDDDDVGTDAHSALFREHRANREKTNAERAQFELDRLRGQFVTVRDVEQLKFTAGRIHRDRMEMIPARVAADLHAMILAAVPEEHRIAVEKALPMHLFETRLSDQIRAGLLEAEQAIRDAARDDADDAD